MTKLIKWNYVIKNNKGENIKPEITKRVKLDDLNIFSKVQINKLHEYGISSAEQFVGLCATIEGLKGARLALSVTQIELKGLLNQVKTHLPSDLSELLSKPAPNVYQLGARDPQKIRKKKE